MQVLEMKFRVPEGEELTEERLCSFDDLGFGEDDVYSEIPGQVWVTCRFPNHASEAEIEASVEEIAEEIMDAIGDMDLYDFEYSSTQ